MIFSKTDVDTLASYIDFHQQRAALDPLNYVVAIAGDMNIRYADKPILKIPAFSAVFMEPKLPKLSKQLFDALGKFFRIEHDHFSHFNAPLGHFNDIDHIYLSPPGWVQLPWSIVVEVCPPEVLYEKGLSDHSPLTCSIRPNTGCGNEPPIPPWVAKSRLFKAKLTQMRFLYI